MRSSRLDLVVLTARVAIRKPSALRGLLRSGLRLAPARWWRSWPPLPLPDPDYLRFRSTTAYGGQGDTPPNPDDVEAWAVWAASFDEQARQ